ncbi:MAG: hypothetical protein OEZ06_08335 [Myxococcales bacterium]|nr:hypothetical protein [Myxococcales bacterium]
MSAQLRTLALALAVLGIVPACSSSSSETGEDKKAVSKDGGTGTDSESSGGSSSGSDDEKSSGGSSGGGGAKTTVSTEDDTDPVGDDLVLLFSPMYSAYDGVHDFKLPAIVQGVQGAKWSANPADMVDLQPDSTTGGIMITTRKAGTVTIIARAGALSGSSELHITDATPEDWELGEMRYNNEIPFPEINIPDGGFPDGGFGDGGIPDGGFGDGGPGFDLPDDLSCRNCHSSLATALDVEHTPQQTAGYSDEDLISIFTQGMKPEGAGFHTPFPESVYTMFHTWEATEAEKKGLVIYLRSLTPKTQGALDFAGLRDQFGGQ